MKTNRFNYFLLVITVFAVFFGILMVLSASGVNYASLNLVPSLKQSGFALIGLVLMFLLAFTVDYNVWIKWSNIIFIVSVICLIAVLFVGRDIKGASRWISLGPLSFQPSELAKIAIIIMTAKFIAQSRKYILKYEGFWDYIKMFALNAVPAVAIFALIYLEGDFGVPFLMLCVWFAMLVSAGLNARVWVPIIIVAAIAVIIMLSFTGYRSSRVSNFKQYLRNPAVAEGQVRSGFYAFASGGVFGKGLGNSQMKSGYLATEAHNDYIFPVIGEEIGFFGTSLVVLFFIIFFVNGMKISSNTKDDFGKFLALGITCMIVFQALFNMYMTVGLIPPKGINLPFISYGGSSMLFTLIMTGILLSVSKKQKSLL